MAQHQPIDLSGQWFGYYYQRDRERPIRAEIEQEGENLSGTMNDEVTDFEASVSELALEEGLPPGADEEIVAKVRSLCPEAPLTPVLAAFHLPEDSVLKGEVDGQRVQFVKVYQGQCFAGFRVGEIRVGKLGEDQEVRYWGTLSPDGSEIQGDWQFVEEGELPLHRSRGSFILRREQEPGEN